MVIALTSYREGDKVYINPIHIVSWSIGYETEVDDEGKMQRIPYSFVDTVNGSAYTVSESPEEIADIIRSEIADLAMLFGGKNVD
jgi:uncharacterized protein YlzI (FlbEa/FlbD family)